jgi:hypothetical protein
MFGTQGWGMRLAANWKDRINLKVTKFKMHHLLGWANLVLRPKQARVIGEPQPLPNQQIKL